MCNVPQPARSLCSLQGLWQGAGSLSFRQPQKGDFSRKEIHRDLPTHKENCYKQFTKIIRPLVSQQRLGICQASQRLGLARPFKRWYLPDSDIELSCSGKYLKCLQISIVWEMSFPPACTIHFISRNPIYAFAYGRRSRLVPLGIKLQQMQGSCTGAFSEHSLQEVSFFLSAGLHNRREQKLCTAILVYQKYIYQLSRYTKQKCFHFRGNDVIKSRFNTCIE